MKKFALFALTLCLACGSHAARFLGTLPEWDSAENKENDPFYINTTAFDTLGEFTIEKFFGIGVEHKTVLLAEYRSTEVKDGVKIGENAFTVAINDKYPAFGGELYSSLRAMLPAESRYAMTFAFDGGWQYMLTERVALDLGGNFTYNSKRVNAAGLPGEGTTFYGDFYVGLKLDVPTTPFAYYTYNPDYLMHKFKVGIAPSIDLSEITGIEGLSVCAEIYYGYNKSNDWNNGKPDREYCYGYIQSEAQIIYILNGRWRFAVGGGYSYNHKSDAELERFSPPQNAWITTSVGIIF